MSSIFPQGGTGGSGWKGVPGVSTMCHYFFLGTGVLVHKFTVYDLCAFLYVFVLQLKPHTYCMTMGENTENITDNQALVPRTYISDTTFQTR